MIAFLARKYVVNTLIFASVLACVPLLAGAALGDALPRALFWGGALAAGYTYWRFRTRNLWPLYDNLRLPRFALLVGLFVAVQLLNLALSALM